MEINRLLTPYNYSNGLESRIKYIVIHYVGATGGAKANCEYYASKYIGASAHYFVGFEGEIWQSVEERNIAWHCGANAYKHPECRNSNSIGIELCVRNKGSQAATSRDWYFEDATVRSAVALTRELMEKYKITADRVVRHYDVTGKYARILLSIIIRIIPGRSLKPRLNQPVSHRAGRKILWADTAMYRQTAPMQLINGC